MTNQEHLDLIKEITATGIKYAQYVAVMKKHDVVPVEEAFYYRIAVVSCK